MILTALKNLAESEGLIENPDYQPMPVRWLIDVDAVGKLLGVTDTLLNPECGKGKPQARKFNIPKRSSRTVQNESEFMTDKGEYVLGWINEDGLTPEKVAKNRNRAAIRHGLYVEEVRLATQATGDPGLTAWLTYIESQAIQSLVLKDWSESDLIAPRFFPDGEALLSDRLAVREYWSKRRRQPDRGTGKTGTDTSANSADRAFCVVTGEPCVPQRLHPSIKGIPPVSDTKGGVPLTSINAVAFDSYGLGGMGCAPISPEAADAYQAALNRLLADGYPDPHTQGGKLPNRNVRLSDNTIVVFWSKNDAVVDLFSDAIMQGGPEHIEAIYKATWKGKSVSLDDPSAFYALTLSGAQGRGTVRGWHETTLGAVLKNTQRYFKDLEITPDDNRPRPLLGILRQMAVLGKVDNIPPNLAGDVFQAVLTGRPFPRSVLDALIRRTRAERTLFSDRAAFIKACLCRTPNLPEIHPMLDEACTDGGYRLGRLFAVLEKVQEDAISAKAGIRDRYYGAASSTPVVVFPQLLRKVPHHLSKLGGRAETYFEKLIQSVCEGLQPPAPFPRTMTLEQQGLFAVGYYHQRQALFTKRDNTANASDSNLPTEDN